jgi:hypothetical protein
MITNTNVFIKNVEASGISKDQAAAIYYGIQSDLEYKKVITQTDLDYAIRDVEHKSEIEICKLKTTFTFMMWIAIYVTFFITAMMNR